jgi:hypothetical protein
MYLHRHVSKKNVGKTKIFFDVEPFKWAEA